MRLFRYSRTSPALPHLRQAAGWLRVSLAALMLMFTLNLAAHAGHAHDDAKAAQTAHAACGYCVTFGGLADAGSTPGSLALPPATDVEFQQPRTASADWRVETAAHPRAPPLS